MDSHIYPGAAFRLIMTQWLQNFIAHEDRDTTIVSYETGIRRNDPDRSENQHSFTYWDFDSEDGKTCKEAMDIHYSEKHLLKKLEAYQEAFL